jgi:hypothetical protein
VTNEFPIAAQLGKSTPDLAVVTGLLWPFVTYLMFRTLQGERDHLLDTNCQLGTEISEMMAEMQTTTNFGTG